MNLQSLQLGKAVSLVRRTTPILMARLTAYLIFWAIGLVYFGLVGGLAWLLAQLWEPLGFIAFIVGLGGAGALYHLAYRYTFFLLKAAHIAVIAELLQHDRLPKDSGGQLAWGKTQVQGRFGDVNAMFVIDEIVNGIVRTFTRTVSRLIRFIPGDTGRSLASVVQKVIRFAVSYIDEAIMARSFWRQDENVWESAEEGIVLYAQAWKPILTNAVMLMLLSFAPFFGLLLLVVVPVGFAIAAINPTLAGWAVAAMLLLAFLVKVAVGDTIAMAAIIATYKAETEQMVPDPATVAQLESLSDKFRELKAKALAAMPNGGGGSAEKPTNFNTVDNDPLLADA